VRERICLSQIVDQIVTILLFFII